MSLLYGRQILSPDKTLAGASYFLNPLLGESENMSGLRSGKAVFSIYYDQFLFITK
ncbi:MAG: hypothetical protein OXE41_04190 [Gammaproteobacteria bacterium]|nr:hypothetical protein [Gammaproteobacteria bacterium]MCY4274582.1 hypothetical protein [Gammaproteobacteria bacterium]